MTLTTLLLLSVPVALAAFKLGALALAGVLTARSLLSPRLVPIPVGSGSLPKRTARR